MYTERRGQTSVLVWLIAVAILMVVIMLLLPATQLERVGPRPLSCRSCLKQIGLSLHVYHEHYGSFPPAYIADAGGRPMHSWRVLLLPFMEEKKLYELYRFDEPWDGPNNRKLHGEMVRVFACPHNRGKQPETETNYLAVVGPQTMWPGEKATKWSEIKDGSSNTIMVVEVHGSGIHWMEPRDLHMVQMSIAINPARGQGVSSGHPHGATFLFADGRVQFLPDETPPDALRAALTIAGGEKTALP